MNKIKGSNLPKIWQLWPNYVAQKINKDTCNLHQSQPSNDKIQLLPTNQKNRAMTVFFSYHTSKNLMFYQLLKRDKIELIDNANVMKLSYKVTSYKTKINIYRFIISNLSLWETLRDSYTKTFISALSEVKSWE